MSRDVVTAEQARLAIELVATVGKMIASKGSIPSGELYVALHSKGISLTEHNAIIDTLVKAKLITKSNHLLTWTGPEEPK